LPGLDARGSRKLKLKKFRMTDPKQSISVRGVRDLGLGYSVQFAIIRFLVPRLKARGA
jgi:hypothetical protein